MYKYTLAFIIYNDEVLLLNRNKNPWMGAWNGVGGKIEIGEDIKSSIIREIKEETSINFSDELVKYQGTVTWNSFDADGQGLYFFMCYLDKKPTFKTPVMTDEGILDWKKISWAIDKENYGIARNIPFFLSHALKHKGLYNYHCIFEGDNLKEVIIKELK